MQLNTRQARIFTLANILIDGKPICATNIINRLECSEPTLTRALKELRIAYSAEIQYSKTGHSYQLTNPGTLDKKTLRRMSEALIVSSELKTGSINSKVILDKNRKKTVSLSLRLKILHQIDRLAALRSSSRSETVEKIVVQVVDGLIKKTMANKNKSKEINIDK